MSTQYISDELEQMTINIDAERPANNGQETLLENTFITPDIVEPTPVIKSEVIQELTPYAKSVESTIPHSEILSQLITQLEPLDFQDIAFQNVSLLKAELMSLDPGSDKAKEYNKDIDRLKLGRKHYLVLTIENVLKVGTDNALGMCKNHEFIYLYNGAYWANIDKEMFQKFLGDAALKMGVEVFDAKHYQFRDQLFKQFLATAYLPTPEPPKKVVFVNLQNGTFEITADGHTLRAFNPGDFLTYQLPFRYDSQATAPIFQAYLDRVLPEKDKQMVLAEYLGYVFIRNGSGSLKEEKALILFGTGANGKSVFFEIVNALLGPENVSSYTLQDLTDEKGYHRATLANKLVNYASEINGKLDVGVFKQLVSGEPVSARLPYGQPFTLMQYAKFIFNCNELPKEVEHTHAYFRRFLIIPFDVTIPDSEQDKHLHTKIIDGELSGVFNWILDGLNRLLAQRRFTECEAIRQAVEQYKKQSDTVQLFIEEAGHKPSPEKYILIKELYSEYRSFCFNDGFKPLNKLNFKRRLEGFGVITETKNIGNVAYLQKEDWMEPLF